MPIPLKPPAGTRATATEAPATVLTSHSSNHSHDLRRGVERDHRSRSRGALGTWEFSAAFSVGRSRRCELQIPTNKDTLTVSKRHVGVTPVGDSADASAPRQRWVLFDYEPMNGTAVNGEPVARGGYRNLRDGDRVLLASAMRQCVELTVRFPERSRATIRLVATARSITDVSPSPPSSRVPSPRAPSPHPTGRSPFPFFSGRSQVIDLTAPLLGPVIRRVETRSSAAETMREGVDRAKRPRRRSEDQVDDTPRRSRRRRHGPDEYDEEERTQGEQEVVVPQPTRHDETNEDRPTSDRVPSPSFPPAAADAASRDSTAATAAPEQERERLMACPVCLEYFYASATLPCSHTFCGFCISSWFRTSLSCPECRDTVRALPVRNRALDDLVQRLVGRSDAYQALVARRAKEQNEAARQGVDDPSALSFPIPRANLRADVFSPWSVEQKLRFRTYMSTQFGETRVAACRRVQLTEQALDCATAADQLVAAQNLLLDCAGMRVIGDACVQRLKIFLYYG